MKFQVRSFLESGGEAARLPAERLPPREGRGLVGLRRETFGFRDQRFQPGAVLGEHSAHFVPLAARGHRLGESRSEPVGLRAVSDERQQRSPLLFNDLQLRRNVVTFERLDALAEGVAGGDRLGTHDPEEYGHR